MSKKIITGTITYDGKKVADNVSVVLYNQCYEDNKLIDKPVAYTKTNKDGKYAIIVEISDEEEGMYFIEAFVNL